MLVWKGFYQGSEVLGALNMKGISDKKQADAKGVLI